MRRIAVALAAFLLVDTASAQTGQISLDHVDGLSESGKIIPGKPVTFYLRVTNNVGRVYIINNAFKFSSPDGASWSATSAAPVWNAPAYFEQTNYVGCEQCDGQPNDSILCANHDPFLGVLTNGHTEIAWAFTIDGANGSDAGKTICHDSIDDNATYDWGWLVTGVGIYAPQWSGPYCFTVDTTCCSGVTGNVDGDPESSVDLSDLTAMIDYLFITFEQPQCIDEANIDLLGTADITDLLLLIEHLFINFRPMPDCP